MSSFVAYSGTSSGRNISSGASRAGLTETAEVSVLFHSEEIPMTSTDHLYFDPPRAQNLISLKTAAALVEVDPRTIKNWIKSGDLQGFRVRGRMWRIDREELLALARPVAPESTDGLV
ncbi:helix-turn-helix domain-containing protein [Nocardia sp. NPDC004722]